MTEGASILVLEDDVDMLEGLMTVLEDHDFEVTGAASAREALEAAQKTSFQLVIHDVRMPEMDGLEALEALRRIQPGVKSIVITGYAEGDAPSRAIKQGAFDYLHKPFTLPELIKTVRHALTAEENQQKNLQTVADHDQSYKASRSSLGSEKRRLLERKRGAAYRAFFVSVRSRKLFRKSARLVWNHLESLEIDYFKTSDEEADALAGRYQDVYERLADEDEPNFANPHNVDVPFAQFYKFFANLMSGSVAVHQLIMARFLRIYPADNERLLEYREQLWG